MHKSQLMSSTQSSSVAYHNGCPGAVHDALCQFSAGSLGSSVSLSNNQAQYVQDADSIRNQEDDPIHQDVPQTGALADAPSFGKEPADDPDAFTVPIESIAAARELNSSVPAKAGMAKICADMACLLLKLAF